jgi:hypothetical protein
VRQEEISADQRWRPRIAVLCHARCARHHFHIGIQIRQRSWAFLIVSSPSVKVSKVPTQLRSEPRPNPLKLSSLPAIAVPA